MGTRPLSRRSNTTPGEHFRKEEYGRGKEEGETREQASQGGRENEGRTTAVAHSGAVRASRLAGTFAFVARQLSGGALQGDVAQQRYLLQPAQSRHQQSHSHGADGSGDRARQPQRSGA